MNYLEWITKIRYCPITKIFNRYEFNIQFEDIVENFNKNWKSFTFALLDLDRFKRANDTYWHSYGDHVLYVLWLHLKEQFSNDDISVFRIWWDEFAVLTDWEYNKEYIYNKLNDILSVFNNNYIIEKPKEGNKISKKNNIKPIWLKQTFSASVWHFECNKSTNLSEEDIYNIVDWAFYEVKENGRNKVTLIK